MTIPNCFPNPTVCWSQRQWFLLRRGFEIWTQAVKLPLATHLYKAHTVWSQVLRSCNVEDLSHIILRWFLNTIKPVVKPWPGVMLHTWVRALTQAEVLAGQMSFLRRSSRIQRSGKQWKQYHPRSSHCRSWLGKYFPTVSVTVCKTVGGGGELLACNKLRQLATYLPFSCFPP